MADVFISYSQKNRAIAQLLSEALVTCGHSVWWDQDLPAGDLFRQTILAELSAARAVLVLWSSSSINSNWVLDEADFGAKHKKLVPATLEPVNPPLGFRQHHTHDLTSWNGWAQHPKFTALLDALRKTFGHQTLTSQEENIRPQEQITIAHSPLYVVRSITLGWGLDEVLRSSGYFPSHTSYPWNEFNFARYRK